MQIKPKIACKLKPNNKVKLKNTVWVHMQMHTPSRNDIQKGLFNAVTVRQNLLTNLYSGLCL